MNDALSVTEAAERLGVSRHHVWLLIKEGRLPAQQNPLDRRQKLIPQAAIDELLAVGRPTRRPLPRTIGIVEDGSLPSRESEDYLRAHWSGE